MGKDPIDRKIPNIIVPRGNVTGSVDRIAKNNISELPVIETFSRMDRGEGDGGRGR